MGLYYALDTKEGGKEFGHAMFEELLPISAEQNEIPPTSLKQKEICLNEIQHVPIKLDQEEIKRLENSV